MTKIIKIDSCYECPECELKKKGKEEQFYCFEADRYFQMVWDIGEGVPEWCPLPEPEESG